MLIGSVLSNSCPRRSSMACWRTEAPLNQTAKKMGVSLDRWREYPPIYTSIVDRRARILQIYSEFFIELNCLQCTLGFVLRNTLITVFIPPLLLQIGRGVYWFPEGAFSIDLENATPLNLPMGFIWKLACVCVWTYHFAPSIQICKIWLVFFAILG